MSNNSAKTNNRNITRKQLRSQLENIVDQIGGNSSSFSGELATEIMQTTAKLIRDKADDGELKLISRSLKELRHALKIFRGYDGFRKVSVFGSARTPQTAPAYRSAAQFSREMAKAKWMTITGAGNGI